MEQYSQFISSLESDFTAEVARLKRDIGKFNFSNCTKNDIEQMILDMNPKSPRDISMISYLVRRYANFLGEDSVPKILDSICRSELWDRAKPNSPKRFISFAEYQTVCHEIMMQEHYNSFYKKVLFRCIYEGVYNRDLSVIKNLRASDIHGNTVTLRDDNGKTFVRCISKDLAEDLKVLGTVYVWDRTNGNGKFWVPIEGMHYDSCFKVENRGGDRDKRYRISYLRVLSEITKKYLQRKVSPSKIYISGIIHRIGIKLAKDGLSIETAFTEYKRNKQVLAIVIDEMKRSGYEYEVNVLREYIRGHLDEF